ncbi:MAG: hypothetical protein J7647_06830 [Cyanobacteria bacterium SBLK]|nr:hypothetical protein [Cyanobacteria bacterium SBLK]
MKLESIARELDIDTNSTITIATISDVPSSCILARQAIEVLGRPGKDSDLEMMGGDGTWTLVWSKPQLTLEDATHLLEQAIARGSASTAIATQPQVDLLATEKQ